MKSLRFAVLRHTGHPENEDHYDILLEGSPGQDPGQVVLMKFETTAELERSRLAIKYQGKIRRRYLEYEGPMSHDRGLVIRVDEGIYNLSKSGRAEFDGKILKGIFQFEEEKSAASDIRQASILQKNLR